MEQAENVIVATRTALSQASALAVQYSFSVVGAIVLLIIGWALARIVSRWAHEGLRKIRGIDETLARFAATVLRYAILILVFVTVLGQFGVQTASIVTALGAAGLAIGLALQGTLQNIAAGIMLLVLRPLRVGEYISTSQVTGTVQDVGLFATELRTQDGVYILAPNSTLWNTPITNYSRHSTRREDFQVTLSKSEDARLAKSVLEGLLRDDDRISKKPPPKVFVNNAGGDKVSMTLRYWVRSGEWENVRNDLVGKAEAAMAEKGLTIL
ncbi:mechanosensitive ion channel family protein [Oryzifoliimicrobium ureilyticus]|uniref:mechanosensitive ion channel family protein n=1 Tax=Oryzifoliimicrobium ureilyticus TaxID=3113724 RepID=UPI0030761891